MFTLNPTMAALLADLVDIMHGFLMMYMLAIAAYPAFNRGKAASGLSRFYMWSFSFGSVIFTFLGGCPITRLAQSLRMIADPNFSYQGSFVLYYLHKLTGVHFTSLFLVSTLFFCVSVGIAGGFITNRSRIN